MQMFDGLISEPKRNDRNLMMLILNLLGVYTGRAGQLYLLYGAFLPRLVSWLETCVVSMAV